MVFNGISSKVVEKLIDILVELELNIPCDAMAGDEYCEKNCKYDTPQRECWVRHFMIETLKNKKKRKN